MRESCSFTSYKFKTDLYKNETSVVVEDNITKNCPTDICTRKGSVIKAKTKTSNQRLGNHNNLNGLKIVRNKENNFLWFKGVEKW